MKTTDMRKLTAADIDKKVLELKEQLFDLKFKAALGQLEHPHKIKQIRKTIARLKTIQSENKV